MEIGKKLSKPSIIVKAIAAAILSVVTMFLALKAYESHGEFCAFLVYRYAFLFVVYAFLMLNVFVDIKVLYNFMFKHRYPIALVVLFLFVLAELNFSSISMFNGYVQPGSGTEFIRPIFGHGLPIRSDEWAISTPKELTYQYCAGEKYNDIIMAAQTLNIKTTGVSNSLSVLTKPFNWGFLFLSAERAVSFFWGSLFIVNLLAGIEFFLVITKGNKLLSFLGSVATVFSSFTMWWGGNSLVTYAMAAVAGIYRFLNTDNRKIRILCGAVIVVFGSAFVGVLYPAWQVPLGYICLALIVWSFIVNRENIKQFKLTDWIIFAATVISALAVIIVFYLENLEYTKSVLNTVYPGSRREYGGYVLEKLFTYPATLLFPFKEGGYAFSEYGMYFSLFPLPVIALVYTLIKSKKKDLLSILLLAVCAFLTAYCTVELPKWLGDISLMSFSTPVRMLTYVDFIQIPILLRAMALMKEENIYIPKRFIVPVAIALSVFIVQKCDEVFVYPDFMGTAYMVVMAAALAAVTVCFVGNVNNKLRVAAIAMFIVVQCIVSAFVLPIQKGLDPIYSKPAAQKALEITEEDPDARWLVIDQWTEANFFAACGAKVINSNNYIPNYELWAILDPENEYEEVWNRYLNLIVTFTDEETSAYLNQPDLATLFLNYGDLDDIGVKYVVIEYPLYIPEEYNVAVNQLYAEDGTFIFELIYN